MSLEYIHRKCAQKLNLDVTNSDMYDWLVDEINIVAENAYNQVDLDKNLFEFTFNYCLDTNSVTLPGYVGIPRGFRVYLWNARISQQSMGPKYHNSNWSAADYCNFRILRTGPLERNMASTAPLTVTLTKPDTNTVRVVINGATNLAGKVEEELVFAPGETVKLTTNQFSPLNPISNEGIASIQKFVWNPDNTLRVRSASVGDAVVTDANDRELARIPNNQTFSRYMIVQVFDFPIVYLYPSTAVDCCYKQRFQPLIFPSDMVGNNQYDNVIIWGVLGGTSNNSISQTERNDFSKMYSDYFSAVNFDQEGSEDKPMDFGGSKWIGRSHGYDRRDSRAFRFQRWPQYFTGRQQ